MHSFYFEKKRWKSQKMGKTGSKGLIEVLPHILVSKNRFFWSIWSFKIMYWPILCQETTFENVTFSPSSGFLTIFHPILELCASHHLHCTCFPIRPKLARVACNGHTRGRRIPPTHSCRSRRLWLRWSWKRRAPWLAVHPSLRGAARTCSDAEDGNMRHSVKGVCTLHFENQLENSS